MSQIKIIDVDNYNREDRADRLVISGLPETEEAKAKEFCDWLNQWSLYSCDRFFKVVPQSYRLSQGMADLV